MLYCRSEISSRLQEIAGDQRGRTKEERTRAGPETKSVFNMIKKKSSGRGRSSSTKSQRGRSKGENALSRAARRSSYRRSLTRSRSSSSSSRDSRVAAAKGSSGVESKGVGNGTDNAEIGGADSRGGNPRRLARRNVSSVVSRTEEEWRELLGVRPRTSSKCLAEVHDWREFFFLLLSTT